MERQSASASLDSGCRDDPYHPPSCRPGIVTVTVPDSLSFSCSLSLSRPLSFHLSFSLPLPCDRPLPRPPPSPRRPPSAARAALRRHERDGPSRRGIFDRAFSFSLFCSFRSCGKDSLRFSASRVPRCEMQLLRIQVSGAMFQFRPSR